MLFQLECVRDRGGGIVFQVVSSRACCASPWNEYWGGVFFSFCGKLQLTDSSDMCALRRVGGTK